MLFHPRTRVALRGGVLLAALYASTSGLIALLWGVAGEPLGSLRAQPSAMALDEALLGLSVIAIGACAGWLVLLTTAVVVETVLGASRAQRASPAVRPGRLGALCPPALRRVLLAGCGVALCAGISGPAVADSSLDGLTVPDRAVAPTVTRPAVSHSSVVRVRAHSSVVRAGDTLWALAARSLPSHASERQITGRWREIYRMNVERIGTDPDLILPGTTLHFPTTDSTDTTEREDRP